MSRRVPTPVLAPVPFADGDADELADGDFLRRCDPGFAVLAGGALTFSAAPASAPAWSHWLEETFVPLLGPILLRATQQAAAGHARELAALSNALHAQLPTATAARLQRAGGALLGQLAPARAAQWSARLLKLVAQGEPAASFPVVFAGWCALFHLPVRSVLLGYAACEWHAASNAPHRGESLADRADEIRAALIDVPVQVEATLRRADFPGFA